MYDFVTENKDLILYLIFLAIALLSYNWGHHVGFIKGFQTGRRAGVRHPSSQVKK
jgi:hypothetical protein